MRLCLASASPRRRELLHQIGVPHLVVVADIDESRLGAESAGEHVLRLARAKAAAVWSRTADRQGLPVLAADTTVALGDEILGKPATREEGVAMLQALAGREHEVLTAIALATDRGIAGLTVESRVAFREISAQEAAKYWDTGEPRDKAGGYAIQGLGAVFVAGLRGSYSGVMGLPLYETAMLLAGAGIPVWDRRKP